MHMRIYYFREALAPQITTRYASLGMRAALQLPSQLFPAHDKLLACILPVPETSEFHPL
jgi:hypothetical protein